MRKKFTALVLTGGTLVLGLGGVSLSATDAHARQLWANPGVGSVQQDGRLADGRLSDGRLVDTDRKLWS